MEWISVEKSMGIAASLIYSLYGGPAYSNVDNTVSEITKDGDTISLMINNGETTNEDINTNDLIRTDKTYSIGNLNFYCTKDQAKYDFNNMNVCFINLFPDSIENDGDITEIKRPIKKLSCSNVSMDQFGGNVEIPIKDTEIKDCTPLDGEYHLIYTRSSSLTILNTETGDINSGITNDYITEDPHTVF